MCKLEDRALVEVDDCMMWSYDEFMLPIQGCFGYVLCKHKTVNHPTPFC